MRTATEISSPAPPKPPAACVPGTGALCFDRVSGRTAITRAMATSPLKILIPRPRGDSAWAYASSFGGGLVAGDELRLSLSAASGTRCFVTTQSATKVYRSVSGRPCRQEVQATVARDALLVWAPDPLICFAGSVYEQRQRFELEAGASLVMLDWFNSGRRARGERWAFSRLGTRTDVFRAGRQLAADALVLDAQDGPIDAPHRMGGYDCFATVLLHGPLVEPAAEAIHAEISSIAVTRSMLIPLSSSRIAGGVMVRALAHGVEALAGLIRRLLAFTVELLGDDPWKRKW